MAPARPSWFLLGNDEFRPPPLVGINTLGGVASPHLLHVLAGCAPRPRRLIITDVNPGQIAWLERLIGLVRAAPDRIGYVESALGVILDDAARARLAAIVDIAPGRVLSSRSGPAWLVEEQALWRHVRAPRGRGILTGAEITAEGLSLDTMVFGRAVRQTLSLVGCRRDGDGQYGGTFAFGCGYLASEAAFAAVRCALDTIDVELRPGDLADEAEMLANEACSEPTAIYVSNVFHRFFVAQSPRLTDAATCLAASPARIVLDQREPEGLIEPFASRQPALVDA